MTWKSLYSEITNDDEFIRETGRQLLPPERVESFNLTSDVGDMGEVGSGIEFSDSDTVALVELLPDANNWDITGIKAPSADFPYRRIMIQNVANTGSRNIRFRNNDGGSAAQNRLLLRQNSISVSQNEMAIFQYDPNAQRWRPISRR
jgi:hypothetical protein